MIIFVFIASNWPLADRNESMEFGISFSKVFARDLGLDWKKAYVEMLDDLNPKKIRVGAYWTEIEKKRGVYDFSDLDWQVNEAAKRDVKMILAFGIKAPRWPECFIPEFYIEDKKAREKALLEYEEALIERYKNNDAIIIWQVENEPFLPFGHCIPGAIDVQLLDKELKQTRKLDDTRQIMVTDSGELSIWVPAAKRADVFGTTLYRIIHKPPIGYVKYPIGPSFFRIKAWIIKVFAGQENIIISELQAEPWGPDWIGGMTIEEQYKSMNPQKFNEIIKYAKETNFSESYLWGVEWWYWLKETKNNDDMWEKARRVITQRE
ncbi:MAG: glycoside hydrolase family 2 TIM barrel-domain containing protein [Patescibacteria group bacterium]|nr:glycoside hydrolase family 2 TIM barrel-domain containing protein [Patescibacteria group bacterium]